MSPKHPTSAALQYLDPSFFERSPKHRAALEEARASQEIGRLVYDLRVKSGLSPRELARAAGLTPKALEKLENGANPRLALGQLRQVATALGQRVELKLVAERKTRRAGRKSPPSKAGKTPPAAGSARRLV
jgi:DNA-binding Xre family transcriptional regulator